MIFRKIKNKTHNNFMFYTIYSKYYIYLMYVKTFKALTYN